MKFRKNMKHALFAGFIAASIGSVAHAATPSLDDLYKIIQKQQAEIDALKSQSRVVEERLDYTAEAVEKAESKGSLANVMEKTTLGGYGEIHYNNYKYNEKGYDDEIDFHRFVILMSHEFSDTLRFFSELELEHSLAGEGKKGEVELEQAYIEWDYAQNHRAKGGVFLIPVGLINETHEPDTFYGTERNNVEKNIIPATWWESGAMFSGEIAPGFSYDVAAHSGLYIDTGAGKFKVRDGRQKTSEAIANDGAYTVRLKYTGIAGLELGVSGQYQSDLQQGKGTTGSSANLLESHIVYGIGDFSLRALHATWDISGVDFETNGYDEQTGWYVEPSYKIRNNLGVFFRYSEYDNQAGDSVNSEVQQQDYGVNYWINPHVVLKADWTDYLEGSDKDAFNLGLGWSF